MYTASSLCHVAKVGEIGQLSTNLLVSPNRVTVFGSISHLRYPLSEVLSEPLRPWAVGGLEPILKQNVRITSRVH